MQPNQAALRMIASIASQKQQQSTNAESDTTLPPPHSEPLLLFVQPKTIADMIEGNELSNPLLAYGKDHRKQWTKLLSNESFHMSSQQLKAMQAICEMDDSEIPLYDFENHLESIGEEIRERDWLVNPAVAQKLKT